MDFLIQTENPNNILNFCRIYFIAIFTYCLAIKFINKTDQIKHKRIKVIIFMTAISIIYVIIKNVSNFFYSTIFLILGIAMILARNINSNIGYTMIITIISLATNYIIFFISIIINFIPNAILGIKDNNIGLISLLIIYTILIYNFSKIKRFNKGIAFLKNKEKDDKFDILILNMSVIILLSMIILSDYKRDFTVNLMLGIIVFAIMLFITIQKSLQLYYKQKLLVQELNETKEELENAKKELKQVEEENLNFSKKSHTLAHRQKSLEHKIQELEAKAEITVEEAGEVKDKLKEIEKDLYKEPAIVELRKTEISQIDDMLKYMQSECIENKINFELQLSGNIHYMVNNLISKDDLEILLADHIKDAIIAINHTDNINRSILVKLGEIEGIYSLYIYDSGIEFETETLENLGKKPSTTHADEGGTGMGFMNTFDTLRKYEASLIINELSKPNKDNYTKVLIFKFDKKNEFKIVSYRQSQPR